MALAIEEPREPIQIGIADRNKSLSCIPYCRSTRIDVFADPSMPAVTGEELAEMDLDEELRKLIEEMKDLSADDLQDQVHRRFEYRICRACQFRFLANPLGKPRERRSGPN